VEFHGDQMLWTVFLGHDWEAQWLLNRRTCPACGRFIIHFENGTPAAAYTQGTVGARFHIVAKTMMIWPKGVSRAPVPPEVPSGIVEDYQEACLVLGDSPKASAALSRRCLQNMLRLAGKVKPSELSAEIQQVIDSGALPNTLAESIDAVRVIGNFAAHPIKSKSTGEIVAVEPDEAEWNLDVLESLFDFYFVLPARAQAKKDALNKKLLDAGKPPLK
jgi:hypothetical protein